MDAGVAEDRTDGLRNETSDGVDHRRGGLVEDLPVATGVPVSRSSRRLSARSGCAADVGRQRGLRRHYPAIRRTGLRRSCQISPASTVPMRRASPRSRSLRRRRETSAAGTSISQSSPRSPAIARCPQGHRLWEFGCAPTYPQRSAVRSKAPWRPERVAAVSLALVDMGAFEVSVSDTNRHRASGAGARRRWRRRRTRAAHEDCPALPRHARDGPRQRPDRARPGCHDIRLVGRRPGRLPVHAGATGNLATEI